VIMLQSGRSLEARHFFEQAAAQAPRDGKAHYLLAKALLNLGDKQGAKIEIGRALALEPNQREFLDLGKQIGVRPAHP
jgi:Flp pilus assembly protein TadD